MFWLFLLILLLHMFLLIAINILHVPTPTGLLFGFVFLSLSAPLHIADTLSFLASWCTLSWFISISMVIPLSLLRSHLHSSFKRLVLGPFSMYTEIPRWFPPGHCLDQTSKLISLLMTSPLVPNLCWVC